MKGLVLKDLYETRFQIIMGLIMALFIWVMLVVSFYNDGFDTSTESESLVSSFAVVLVDYTVISVFTTSVKSTLNSDVAGGWADIRQTMPVTNSGIIMSKIISTAVTIVIYMLLCLVGGAVLLLSGFNLNAEVIIAFPVCISLLQMIALVPVYPLSFKFGAKTANAFFTAFMLITAAVLTVFAFAAFSNDISPFAIRLLAYGALPCAAAVTVFVSYRAGKKLIAVNF